MPTAEDGSIITQGDDYEIVQVSHNFRDQTSTPIENEVQLLEQFNEWVRQRLNANGCIVNEKVRQNPLGWRVQYGWTEEDGEQVRTRLSKQICGSEWKNSQSNQRGYQGGNLVHRCHDRAYLNWGDVEASFDAYGDKSDLTNMLPTLLRAVGVNVDTTPMRWEEYLQVRAEAGIRTFGSAMAKVRENRTGSNEHETASKFEAIERAYQRLHRDLDDYAAEYGVQGLVDVWLMETETMWGVERNGRDYYSTERPRRGGEQVNNVNHAFRAIAWPGSPIMQLLDVPIPQDCQYFSLYPEKLKAVMEICMTKEDSFAELAKRIFDTKPKPKTWKVHENVMKDDNGKPLHISQCAHCKRLLADTLVRRVRATRGRAEKRFVGQLCKELNAAGKHSGPGTFVVPEEWLEQLYGYTEAQLLHLQEELLMHEDPAMKARGHSITSIVNEVRA